MNVINLSGFLKELNSQKHLNREEKFHKIINFVYKEIYQIKKDNYDTKMEKVKKLVDIGEKEVYQAREIGIKEAVNSIFGRA
jgi:hypothetical protein